MKSNDAKVTISKELASAIEWMLKNGGTKLDIMRLNGDNRLPHNHGIGRAIPRDHWDILCVADESTLAIALYGSYEVILTKEEQFEKEIKSYIDDLKAVKGLSDDARRDKLDSIHQVLVFLKRTDNAYEEACMNIIRHAFPPAPIPE